MGCCYGCDLQDRPEEIVKLYNKAIEGFDLVLALRKTERSSSKKITSKLFYLLLSFLSGMKFNGEVGNFGIYSKKVVNNIREMREPFRFC